MCIFIGYFVFIQIINAYPVINKSNFEDETFGIVNNNSNFTEITDSNFTEITDSNFTEITDSNFTEITDSNFTEITDSNFTEITDDDESSGSHNNELNESDIIDESNILLNQTIYHRNRTNNDKNDENDENYDSYKGTKLLIGIILCCIFPICFITYFILSFFLKLICVIKMKIKNCLKSRKYRIENILDKNIKQIKKNNNKCITNENICTICTDTCKNKEIILNCKHKFHIICLKSWITHQFNNNLEICCPMCRQGIFDNNYIHQKNFYIENINFDYSSDSSISDQGEY